MNDPTTTGPSQTETNPLRSYYVFLIVFVLLAALTIAVSLFFMHSAVVSFDGVFARSDDITRAQVMLENVSRLLLEVNAAGNDIFETRDLPRETARFRQASAQLRRALADAPTAHFSRTGFEAHFDAMLRAEEHIFSLFAELLDPTGVKRPEQQILGEAAARMAEMDRAQLHAMSVLRETANALIREHQVIQDEGRRVLNERWWRELIVLTFVTVSLGSGWFLWRKLQQVHEHFVREQQRVQEERRNRLASVGEVCFSVAHGIKNPVAAIASSAQLVLEYGHLDDTSRQRIADLLTSTRSLSARVTQLLNFSRVGPTHRERFTPKDVFTWSLREIEPTLVDQGIRVLREDDDNAAILEGDRNILIQAVQELLGNAKDVLPEGGTITLRVVTPEEDPKSVELCVVDDGPGMPDDVKKRAFELFFSRKPQGTGVGLATVRRAVELHQGSVRILDVRPHGADVRIRLPRVSASLGGGRVAQ